jgi:hypothetical protein
MSSCKQLRVASCWFPVRRRVGRGKVGLCVYISTARLLLVIQRKSSEKEIVKQGTIRACGNPKSFFDSPVSVVR